MTAGDPIAAKPPAWRTFLVLGRVSNLPTVWSNCIAGWLLAGNGFPDFFLIACLGATSLYIGGMFLNDAFDIEWDRQHRPSRPLPSGIISLHWVWGWGLALLVFGLLCLSVMGQATALLAALLALNILVYDAIHKIFAFSPVLMGTCRMFLQLAAASTGFYGVTGLSIWSSMALGCYVAGVSFIAAREKLPMSPRVWPFFLLGAPILLGTIVNQGGWRWIGALFMMVLFVWILYSMRFVFATANPRPGQCVASLLAGIVLVDLLAVAGHSVLMTLVFAALFGLSLLAQRFIPAT